LFGLIETDDFESEKGIETSIGKALLVAWLVAAVLVVSNLMVSIHRGMGGRWTVFLQCISDCCCNKYFPEYSGMSF
jgi:hypothetical protein